jgi:acetolactate synthase regulatory subunit
MPLFDESTAHEAGLPGRDSRWPHDVMTRLVTPTLTLSLVAVPTTRTLAGVISVLHSRGADVKHLTWTTDPDQYRASVTLEVEMEERRQEHLCGALHRLVDVTSVTVTRARSVHAPP